MAKDNGDRVGFSFTPAEAPDGAVDDPVVDLNEEAPESLLSSQEFVNDVQDTTRHIVAGEVVRTPETDAIGLDRRYMTPERSIKASSEPADIGGDASDPLGDLIRAEVAKMMSANLAEIRGESALAALGTVPFQGGTAPLQPAPPSFTKHYRCDIHPNLQIQELNMDALEYGGRPQSDPIAGNYIKFRNGHLYLDENKPGDANKIKQIEWMRVRSMYSPDGETTQGGNPSIYEDDGGDIYRCTAGCDYITASKNAWKAHMRSTHSIEVS